MNMSFGNNVEISDFFLALGNIFVHNLDVLFFFFSHEHFSNIAEISDVFHAVRL